MYCVKWTQYSSRPKRSAICNRCFPGPTRVLDANGISIASAVFAGLTRWQTDWQTDWPHYSVGNNRRSAQQRSPVRLLSMATTSIYWSSPLDRSDQLQQSAAIFSCMSRRLQCMWRYYNIASKRAFRTGVLNRWHNCLLIYWHSSCLVPAFDDTYHVPATEWCQRYLPWYLLSVFNSVCFSSMLVARQLQHRTWFSQYRTSEVYSLSRSRDILELKI